MSILSAFRAAMVPEMREAAQARKRVRHRQQQIEAERQEMLTEMPSDRARAERAAERRLRVRHREEREALALREREEVTKAAPGEVDGVRSRFEQEARRVEREFADERERQRLAVESAKLADKFREKPDTRMDNLYAHIESLGLSGDVVAQFKSLTTGAKFALVEAMGDHLAEGLPIYLSIEPGARAMALRWARAGNFIQRLKSCAPFGD
jgi:hypothetical protein